MVNKRINIICKYCKIEKKVWSCSSGNFCSNECAANFKTYEWIERWLLDLEDGGMNSATGGASKRVKRYFKECIHECEECGKDKQWNNKPLTFEIDHTDGNRWNNKRNNLKYICPNCHSQTPTFRAKNMKKRGPVV